MTAVLTRPESTPGSMPSWSIVADLTPPELINSRWLAVLRRRIAVGLVLIAALCAAAYTYAVLQQRSATDAAEAASARTTYLNRAAAQYDGITYMETTVQEIDAQVATAMKDDVNVAGVIASINRRLPRSMSIQSISLVLAAEGSTEASSGLDTSGGAAIGTATISGTGRSLDDLPTFVEGLTTVRGLANVLPVSNQASEGSVQFTVTVDLTDTLHTHAFDLPEARG